MASETENFRLKELKNKHLTLFFTYGVSLKLWQEKGMLDRELKLYEKLGEYFGKIYFLTYGCEDSIFADELRKKNIWVLPKKYRLPNFIYSIILPLIYRRELLSCDFYKTNQMLGSWSAVIAKWFFKKKLIVRTGYTLSIFSKKVSKIKFVISKIIEFLALNNSDLFVVATQEEKEYFDKYKNKVKVIPNYVDTDLFKPMPELKNKENKTVLLFIGRLERQKNLENLILALENFDGVRLQVIGSGSLKNRLENLANGKKVSIEFLGNKPYNELPKYINYSDIFVLPSLYEGNPKVLLEAMSCGKVVLGANTVGSTNIITDKKSGFLSLPDAVSLRSKIKEIFSLTSGELLQKISFVARDFINKNYSLKKVLNLEIQNYEEPN